ncbi:MAG: extracellular solute-binding protein [Pseudomonadota bacterium]|nr:extracellular solute-binding protein [Pseudomonadota bacterium]
MDHTTLHAMKRRAVLTALGAGALSALGVRAQGAAGAPGRNDALLQYQGADREAKLLAGAKKEGVVVIYTSLATTESVPLTQAFEKKYGIKAELWRALSDKVVQRTITEAQGRRHAVDVVETNGPELEMITREQLFAPFYSPYIADLPAFALPAHRQWVSDRMNFFVVAYNTQKVKREEIPKSYEGFLDPKWKGRIGIEATDSEWMAAIVKQWGDARGMGFFRQLADMKPDMRKGHILLAELVVAGEVQVGLSVYNANAESMKRRGGPIDWVPVEPVIARPQGLGIARNAPHPNAALLFADFVISPEGQQLFNSLGRVPVSVKVKSNLNNFKYTMADPSIVLDESAKWEKIWDELFLRR